MKYEQVFIKSESDLPKDDSVYLVHLINADMITNKKMTFLKTDINRWMTDIDWYLQPLPEQTERKEEIRNKAIALITQIWNAGNCDAHDCNTRFDYKRNLQNCIDNYIDSALELMEEYKSQPSEVSDENIEKMYPTVESGAYNAQNYARQQGAKAMRDGKITHKQQ